MATSAQITANRENAQHSAGPVTIDGKARSAANSTKHGLSGAFSILPNEDPSEFNSLLEDLRRQHSPRTPFENFCVDSMAQAHWRLARARRLETRMMEQIMESDPSAEPDSAVVSHLLTKGAAALNTLQRYAAEAERAYYRAHKEFQKAREQRVINDTVVEIDTNTLRKIVRAPTPDHPDYPKHSSGIKRFPVEPGENLALRL